MVRVGSNGAYAKDSRLAAGFREAVDAEPEGDDACDAAERDGA
jgi:hypothetical protein